MKTISIALALLFAVGLSSGCNNEKYEVMKDGTKWFGKRVLPDGTTTARRVEFPGGQKDFDETWNPNGTSQIARVEKPDGTKFFDETVLQDGTRKVAHMEMPDGEKWFDVTLLPDGKSKKIARSEFPNGEKDFEVSIDKDGKAEIKRVEYTDGRKQFDVTQLADGSRVENGHPYSTPTAVASSADPTTGTESDPTIERFASQLMVIRGRRFKVLNAGVGDEILQDIVDKIPQNQFVDLIAMYKAMEGLDGSTTLQGLAKSRAAFIGKYYMLQGDVFQIQSDRDYPSEGLNEFSMFGQVNLVGNYYIPVNVECISVEQVPPYQLSPVLGKIVDFKLGTNRAGKAIIIPVVQVVAVLGTHPYSKEDEEIIINQQ